MSTCVTKITSSPACLHFMSTADNVFSFIPVSPAGEVCILHFCVSTDEVRKDGSLRNPTSLGGIEPPFHLRPKTNP